MAHQNLPTGRDDLREGVLTAVDLVDYQVEAVVSRTIVKKGTGTITVFAFDKGQELSEHVAPFEALAHLIDGEAEIKIAGKPFLLKAGQMIILPAQKPHAVRALTKFKMTLTMIKV